MVSFVPKSSTATFNEIAIADFGSFQIAVPTKATLVNKRIFSAQIPTSQRHYQSQGWLIHNGQVIAALEKLIIGSVCVENSSFKPIQRIAPAIPISFEVKSAQPLSARLSTHAAFTCKIPDADFPFYSIFQQVRPRFVRVYAFSEILNLPTQVERLLAEEALFIKNNAHQLKQVPFYKAQFEL